MTLEYIDTQTSTGSDFTEFTFADAVDFTAYSDMYCTFQFATDSGHDVSFRVGDSGESGVLATSTYAFTSSNINAGVFSTESTNSGDWSWIAATHPIIYTQYGVGGWLRVFLNRDSSDVTYLSMISIIQGFDSLFITSGYQTTTQDDLKYFRLYVGANDVMSGSNVTCYKMRRS